MAGAGIVLLVFAAIALSALRAEPARFAGALGLIAVSPLLLGNLVLTEFDLWVAALAMGGLAALLTGRSRTAAMLLGAAIATKLWPAVLVPLGLVWIWRSRGKAASLRWLSLVVVVCAAFFLPFAALAPAGVAHSFGLQIDRPLQIESLGAAFLLAAHNWPASASRSRPASARGTSSPTARAWRRPCRASWSSWRSAPFG